MPHQKQAILVAKAELKIPILGTRMAIIESQFAALISENSAGFLEADSMLAKVVLGFPLIPFKAHDRSPST